MQSAIPQIWNGEPVPSGLTVAELRSLVQGTGDRRWAAIIALANKPGQETRDALVEFLRSSDPLVRRFAVEAVGNYSCDPNAAELVAPLLYDTNDLVVRTAIGAAANLRLMAVHARIADLINHIDESMKMAAINALESLWQPSDFDAVFERYCKDRSDAVRKQAAMALRNHVTAQQWRVVFEAFRHDPLPRHRVWACELAATFGDKTHGPALDALLDDPDGHARRAAQLALERIITTQRN